MWKLFLIVFFSLVVVVVSLIFFLKTTLVVLAIASCILFILFKKAPLKATQAPIKKIAVKEEKPLHRDKLIA